MPTHQPTRRGFIALTGAATLAGIASNAVAAQETQRDSFTIAEGTDYETEVFVVEAPESGPTSMVVGGLHGDEQSGVIAAENLLGWTPASGRLVVIPRANEPALEEGTRGGPSGRDQNRQFIVGSEPTTEIARAIWEVVETYQPDTLLDLHSSWGIYGVDENTYGQAIFHSRENGEGARANEAAAYLNENYVPESMPEHDFVAEPLQYTDGMLVTKAASELGTRSFLFEVTRRETDLETQAEWTEAGTIHLVQSAESLGDGDEDPDDGDEDGEEEPDDGDDGPDDSEEVPDDGDDGAPDDGGEDEPTGIDARIDVDVRDVGLSERALAFFRADASSSPAEIECYEWDTTGDGEFDSTGATARALVSIVEPTAITLRITDERGCVDTASVTLQP
ncbi:succinylglutamate desuccinylase/aspartoacylase family protein [Natrononativus amylolyticus]|uniref:succinylglutamate desuccinylase/aspartoacylase family protein n=1 Tax=Natrononativus amylolyticus TaxID=2963434 RepID=UPI0020CD4A9D|nr:succinylglutamate desuccinylase/aspartoacylase family protein [Natrononativus amylolyticus]